MNLPAPIHATYGIWLRAPSSSGGKDWLGFVTDQEVIAQWGRTGKVVQSKVLCGRPSRHHLQKKIEEKFGKGYRLVGEYEPGHGWSHQQTAARTPNHSTPGSHAPPPDAKTPRKTTELLSRWLGEPGEHSWF